MKPDEGRRRVVIEEVKPAIEGGRYAVKRVRGDRVQVTCALFGDGHDHVAGRLLYRRDSTDLWQETRLVPLGNDIWEGVFPAADIGLYHYTLEGWVDHFDTWSDDLKKRLAAEQQRMQATPATEGAIFTPQNIPLAFQAGALLLEQAAERARKAGAQEDATFLSGVVHSLRWMAEQKSEQYDNPITQDIVEAMERHPDLRFATRFDRELPVWVDRELARFSSWYELFPRSTAETPGAHGSFADVERRLPEIAEMGFDVLYMPPIHPIGRSFRKGKNNSVSAQDGDAGSPWAIGAAEGGHTDLHPQLGTLADFEHLLSAARDHGIELALDIAFQCSPEHPWVKAHPDWFLIRPDGSIQYAENPPKKYQDIYPLNFESPDWKGLWDALYGVFAYWAEQGVRIFRVDNPHTKALPFWEWVITELHVDYPDAIFLAEAFTRPHVMYSLAKAGFTQSYTYFTWRTEKTELQEYVEEITQPPVSDFFRPNFWPNTPDILPVHLQSGDRGIFLQRMVLATTLTANWGVYGPAYELLEHAPMKPGGEEYLNSEKYEIRAWDRDASYSLAPMMAKLNAIRRQNPALQQNESLFFHPADNPQILCYSKTSADRRNTILVAVNLDATQEQAAWVYLDLKQLDLEAGQSFDVEDLLTGDVYTWHDRSNYVALRPQVMPAHIFRIHRNGIKPMQTDGEIVVPPTEDEAGA
jgi:starch synthase (maltosyl-transferring)